MNPIPYGRQQINGKDIQAVITALRSDYLTQGPLVKKFEADFAEYVGAKYAVSVSNGTAALHLATMALDLQPKQKVITTPITFAASANCIRYSGAEVVFADVDPETALLDINKVRELLENSPKGTFSGIIPVDFAGYAVDLEAFRKLADEHGLWIVEDACHSPGGSFTDSKGISQRCGNGNFAELSIFSFHPVKHIACGEGGMVTTNDKELYEKLLMLRTHGITKDEDKLTENHGKWYYEMQTLGYNYRLPDINCALGISQLERAEKGIERRRQIAKKYNEAFEGMPFEFLQPSSEDSHAYHLYVIRTKHRKELYDRLREKGIYAQVHYIPVHTMPYYKDLGWENGMMPAAEKYYDECLSLPMFPSLKESEQQYVIDQIKLFYAEKVNTAKKIAIIPARGGSKRILRKNIRTFIDKPIIAYSIETAINSGLFDEVMVSTDDPEIAEIALRYGAKVPVLRSSKNASDTATTAEVLLEVLEDYKLNNKDFGFACCLYPTAPLVDTKKLKTGFSTLITGNFDTVMPVTEFSYPIQRAYAVSEEEKLNMVQPEYKNARSQDLEKRFHDAGQFYWFRTDRFLEKRNLITDNVGAMKISEMEAQDIDVETDWEVATLKYHLINNNEDANILSSRRA